MLVASSLEAHGTGLLALRERIAAAAVPCSPRNTRILATWNVRELGRRRRRSVPEAARPGVDRAVFGAGVRSGREPRALGVRVRYPEKNKRYDQLLCATGPGTEARFTGRGGTLDFYTGGIRGALPAERRQAGVHVRDERPLAALGRARGTPADDERPDTLSRGKDEARIRGTERGLLRRLSTTYCQSTRRAAGDDEACCLTARLLPRAGTSVHSRRRNGPGVESHVHGSGMPPSTCAREAWTSGDRRPSRASRSCASSQVGKSASADSQVAVAISLASWFVAPIAVRCAAHPRKVASAAASCHRVSVQKTSPRSSGFIRPSTKPGVSRAAAADAAAERTNGTSAVQPLRRSRVTDTRGIAGECTGTLDSALKRCAGV